MQWRAALVGMTVGVAMLVAGCGPAGGSPQATTLTAASDGSPVSASVGQHLFVKLDANPTTGYSWQLQPGLDTAVVTYLGDQYQPNSAASGLVGGGGTDTLEFVAAGAGTTTISLVYAQAGSGQVGSTFTVNVTVS